MDSTARPFVIVLGGSTAEFLRRCDDVAKWGDLGNCRHWLDYSSPFSYLNFIFLTHDDPL